MGSRREFLKSSAVLGVAAAGGGCASMMPAQPADTLIVNARIATLDARRPSAEAIAIRGERILAVGSAAELNAHKDEKTRVIDAGRRTIVPGLNDAHTHFIRGGLTYTNEVRWDGVPSLADWLPVRHYGGYHRNAAGPMPALAAHTHPAIIGDAGAWSMECPCGAL